MRYFCFIFFLMTQPALAEKTAQELLALPTAEAQGEAIAIEFDDRDIGFIDQSAMLTMTLTNSHGQSSSRTMRSQILENPDRAVGDKSIIVFDTPKDVKGTALLAHAKILDDDDQWLFLPALKRIKRISSKNKSGPFVGSEFAYEDITSNEVGKYSWKFLANEPCTTVAGECFKLESLPKYKNSGYTKRYVWIDHAHFRPIKIDFYDRKGTLLKTQKFEEYHQHLDKFWRADLWTMTNHQTGKSTVLHYRDYQFKQGLTDKDFVKSRLQNVR